jgi:hypothetical protein
MITSYGRIESIAAVVAAPPVLAVSSMSVEPHR